MAFNILIVDDSAIVRAVISKALKLADVPINELYQAGHGKEALDILEECWVDLVFCDISMPVMDGEEFVLAMNENGMIDSIPVVIVSCMDRKDRGMRMGADAYLVKPIERKEFLRVLHRVMAAPAPRTEDHGGPE